MSAPQLRLLVFLRWCAREDSSKCQTNRGNLRADGTDNSSVSARASLPIDFYPFQTI
jgi:hypothetical protein